MNSPDRSTNHTEHDEAECEHVTWLEDIARWRADHREAGAMLAQAQAALLDCDVALKEHAETVRAHQSRMPRDQRAIDDQERGGGEADRDTPADSLEALQARHDQAREAHQRIKQHHGIVTKEIRRLSETLHVPM